MNRYIFHPTPVKRFLRHAQPLNSCALFILTFVLTFIISSGLSAAEFKIVNMHGVYDFDKDDLVEFLTIEEGQLEGRKVTLTGYYEIDELGFPQLVWSFPSDDGDIKIADISSLVSARIADMDGNAVPEIIVGANSFSSEDKETTIATVFLFNLNQGSFALQPSLTVAASEPSRPKTINNLDIIDIDNDGRDEIAMALGGADERGIIIFRLNEKTEPQQLTEVSSFSLNEFSSTLGQIHVAGLDYNNDGFSDLLAFSPERNILRVQALINRNDQLVRGPNALNRIPGMSNMIPPSITSIDWNNDGNQDLLIPFRSGHLVSLSLTERKITVNELGIDAGPLSDIGTADFNQDNILDLLLISGDQGIVTLVYGSTSGAEPLQESFSISGEGEAAGAQIYTALPEIVDGAYLGTVIAGGWTGETSEVFYFELGTVPILAEEIEIDTYIAEEKIEEPLPETVAETVQAPQMMRYSEWKPLPPGIFPTYVLPPFQTFAYTISEDEGREFYSFRWVETPPRGMYFHYETRSVKWVPDERQLGAYELSFQIKMKVGETIITLTDKSTNEVTHQMVPELSTLDSRFWIYVNDPPKILSEPEKVEFVATSTFQYQVVASDYNKDAFLLYSLETNPEGMVIDQNGLVFWQTDETHLGAYDVRVVVSDGFDQSIQTFILYSRGQVAITSQPESEATVDQLYEYQTEVLFPGEHEELVYTMLRSPHGMTIDTTGLITWMPQNTQIDRQGFVVTVNHGFVADTQNVSLFVNHPPILKSIPAPMTMVALFDTFVFQFEVEDPNEFDVIRYNPMETPPGMQIDHTTGLLRWTPTEDNFDFSTAIIEISDGKIDIEKSFDFFVNGPITITSEPITVGTVGEKFEYKIETRDQNRGCLMSFSQQPAPLPARPSGAGGPVLPTIGVGQTGKGLAKITPIYDVKNTNVYSIIIEDDVYSENIDLFINEFKSKKSPVIELEEKQTGADKFTARVNLKKYIQDVFYENDRFIIIAKNVGGRSIKIEQFLRYFFKGEKANKIPKVIIEQIPFNKYQLLDFPDGMTIDNLTGVISWTPTINQCDYHTVTYLVSDGYSSDEQQFSIYVNHPAMIVSTPPDSAEVNQLYKYQLIVDDINTDGELTYELIHTLEGMQVAHDGKISWTPSPSQINNQVYTVKVSDGYSEVFQTAEVFVNMAPSVISKPRLVALTDYLYSYRLSVEDLNGDDIKLTAVKIPEHSRFDEESGVFQWKPRRNQRGSHDIILSATDVRGATTNHEFQIYVFEDPSSKQFISTSWPLLLAFIGAMFSVGVTAVQ